jgi:hypothetical protein
MSTQITTAFVEQYSANVQHLVQQKGSRLRGAVRYETVRGKNAFFEQIGSTAAQIRTSRHADTPRMDTPHARRRVSLSDYDWADLIDDPDKIRMLIDPASPYATAAMWAMGRAMDEAIIDAMDGTAYTGVAGGTSTVYDTANTVDVQVRDVGVTAADLGLNVPKLIEAKRILDANDVDPDMPRHIIVPARQISSLLNTTKATSSDYASVKALVEGKINTFMGFNFIMTSLVETDANTDDKCVFWAQDGMLLAVGAEPMVDIGPRRDKNNATQVFVSMTIGATRMEEKKVGYIECDIDAGPGA